MDEGARLSSIVLFNMNKENILYCALGLLLGYVIAFTFVTYHNLNEGADAKSVKAGESLAAGQSGQSNAANQEAVEAAVQASAHARANRDDFNLQMTAAELNYNINDFEECINFLTRAVELRPDEYRVLVLLGELNYRTGRYEYAEYWYKEALKKNPEDLDVRTDLGLSYFMRKPPDIESALKEFRNTLKLDPRHELSLQNLTAVLTSEANAETNEQSARRQRLREAEQTFTLLEDVNPNNPAIPSLRNGLERARTSLGTANAGERRG